MYVPDTGLVEQSATFLLVRHAHADCTRDGQAVLCGRYDAPLSERGRWELDGLRRRLQSELPVDAVYCSPLSRACDTAACISNGSGAARTLMSLAEIDCGDLDGWPIARIEREHTALWRRNFDQTDDDFRWPGGESYAQFRRRISRVLQSLARSHRGQRILAFTHAGVISQIAGMCEGIPAARWEVNRPENSSLTEVELRPDGLRLLRFNQRGFAGPVAGEIRIAS